MRKKLIYVEIGLYEHQISYLKDAAKKKGLNIAARNKRAAWYSWKKILRQNLDEYIFFIRPRIKEIIKARKDERKINS